MKYFKWMQQRVKKANRICDFPYNNEGYLEFCREMGPIPKGMRRPSVGRIDHDKGYVKGNIRWEAFKYNVWRNRRQEANAPSPYTDDEIPF